MNTLIARIKDATGHEIQNMELLTTALTHSSTGAKHNYERLEFLGDRVLGLVVAETLFAKFPDEPEGHMAKRLASLVQGTFLTIIAREIGLGAFIKFSDAEAAAGGADNDNILADVMEAVIGALYVEAGLEACQRLIATLWGDRFDTMLKPPQHPKTGVQEWAQGKNLPLPRYIIKSQSGPDHAPIFEIELTVQGYEAVTASGKSRQEAEKAAAQTFLDQNSL
ncbi:MAG: ribonuclease III [Alphaproteobacteria bacterium]